MKKFNKRLFLLFVSGLLLSACIKDEGEITDLDFGIEPEFGIPLARVTIAADKIIENFDEEGLLTTGQNGQISLVYADTLESFDASEILDLPDQNFSTTFELAPEELQELEITGEFTIEEDSVFSFITQEGDILDSIRFESGLASLLVSTDGNVPISGFIRVLGLDETELLTVQFEDDNPPIQADASQDLTGVLFEFINNAETTNGLRIQYELTFSSDGDPIPGVASVDLSLLDYSIQSAAGYIAPRDFQLDDLELEIDIFNEEFDGSFRIEDPQLNLYFFNTIGFSLKPTIEELFGLNNQEEILVIEGSNIVQPGVIPAATTPGIPEQLIYSITNETMTPTVTDFLEFKPNFISGDFKVRINDENQEFTFIDQQSSLDVNFDVEIPVYGSISDFILVDTFEVDLGDIIEESNENDELASLTTRLIVNNGFPLDASVQLVLTDSLFQPLDSLYNGQEVIFASAPVNYSLPEGDPNYGRATGKTKTISDVLIEKERLRSLEDVTHCIIRVQGATTNGGDEPIRLFADDAFDVSLSAKLKLDIDG
jgi:hypothetical protein